MGAYTKHKTMSKTPLPLSYFSLSFVLLSCLSGNPDKKSSLLLDPQQKKHDTLNFLTDLSPISENGEVNAVIIYANSIDNDGAYLNFGGYLSDYSGSDVPEFKIEFYDATGGMISQTANYASQTSSWNFVQDLQAIPSGTRSIRMILMGTRNTGTDNDSYFDDLFIKVQTSIDDCEEQAVGIEEQEDTGHLQVFPNPSHGKISMRVGDPLDEKSYFISNAKGEKVKNGKLKKGVQTIDLSSLMGGIYFLNVKGLTESERFVLQ